jgi:hypothetical protein
MSGRKLKLLLTLSLLILLAACGPTTTGGPDTPEPPADSAIPEGAEPPPAALTIDGRRQTSGVGTYCWAPTGPNGTAVCADMVGIPTSPEPLPAAATFTAAFELPELDGRPHELSLSAIPVSGREPMPGDIDGWLWWPYETGEFTSLPLDRQTSAELTLEPGLYVLNLFVRWSPYGDVAYGFLVEVTGSVTSGDFGPEVAAYAEMAGISLVEAGRRLRFQETIGNIQPDLAAEFPNTFGGLWIQHQPDYAIVIALTEGDLEAVRPIIAGYEWAELAEVRPVEYSLRELEAAQIAAMEAAAAVDTAVSTSIDVMNNRVELMVGNPELFLGDLDAAGISLPDVVVVLPSLPGEPLPDTNHGLLLEIAAPDGRTLYLPKQAPSGVSMLALLEGTLIEAGGCLRVTTSDYPDGFLVLWPYDTDLRFEGDLIEVVNGRGQVIARVGEALSLGGGAVESAAAVSRTDQTIPGLPIAGCPGPYWVAGPLEPLAD